MKRVRSSDEKEVRLFQVPNRGSFKKRKVEMGEETRAAILHATFLEVFPNICARSIEIEGNYRTVSRLAQVCKNMQQQVKEFVLCISTYFCEETFLVKSDAIRILETLLIHRVISNQSIINDLVKKLTMTFFDPQVDSHTRTNAVIAAINTIDLADHIDLDPDYITALLNRMMNVLKSNIDERTLNFHGYIFAILNKFHDKGLIKLTDLDQVVLAEYHFSKIIKNKNVLSLCRSNTCLLFCKLANNNLIDNNEDENEIEMDSILYGAAVDYYDVAVDYSNTNIPLDTLFSLELLVHPEDSRLNIGQQEFLKKYATEKFCIQSFEESKDMIDSLCNLDLDNADSVSFMRREEFIKRSIFPIITDLDEATPKFVKHQVLILVALINFLEHEIVLLGQSNANAIEKLIKLGLEMFNDFESSPRLKESIVFIIICYVRPKFARNLPEYPFFDIYNYMELSLRKKKPLKDIHEHSFFYEIADSLYELALSVINSNEYASKYIYHNANQIVYLLSRYHNDLSESSDSSESSDDFFESPDEL